MHGEDCDCKTCMAKGGEVKGVHEASKDSPEYPGRSKPGWMQRAKEEDTPYLNKDLDKYSKESHQEKLNELKSMPNPNLKGLAEGGEVEGEDPDSELHEQVGHEIMGAIHSKDHKKLMDGLKAIVLSHMSKKED